MTGRHIVVHHCRPGLIEPGLFMPDDVVFFDDCLYSQYRFFMENAGRMRGVSAVFAFSPGLLRRGGTPPIDDVDSAEVHAVVNMRMKTWSDPPPDQARAFMSAGELHQLEKFKDVRLALHGCVHLRLQDIPRKVDRLAMFRRDAEDAVKLAAQYCFKTDVFVYPYAFCEDGYDGVLRSLGFKETYARPGAYRIAVENLNSERSSIEDS